MEIKAWSDEWASFIVVSRCLDASLCQQDSRNGDGAIGVGVPDVMDTHS